jgi:hypothetical protein
MACFVPDAYKHMRWHVIWPILITGKRAKHFEIAEWVNCEDNGLIEKGHWVRWGYCGDFPSLCKANYIGPFPDQAMLENATNKTE